MQKTYGIILGIILLLVCLYGSIQIYRNSEKKPSDFQLLIALISSDLLVAAIIITLFFFGS